MHNTARTRTHTHTHTHTFSRLRRWVLDYIIHMLNHESEKEVDEMHHEHASGAHGHGHGHGHGIPSLVVRGLSPAVATQAATNSLNGSQNSGSLASLPAQTRETSLTEPFVNNTTAHDGGEQGIRKIAGQGVPQDCQTHLGANPSHGSQDHLHVLENDRSVSYVSAIEVRTALTVDEENTTILDKRLLRMALVTGLAISLHNFPEGLATFVAAAQSPDTGAPIAIAIGIHNIPEGICVAAPIFHATGSRWRAFFWGTVSGLAETLAGAIG
jgi:zinc transporter ZupT